MASTVKLAPSILAADFARLADDAAAVDGALLVVDTRRTRRAAVRQAAEMLDQAGVPLLGVVLNKLTRRATGGYYDYYEDYHNGPEDSSNGDSQAQRKKRIRVGMLKRLIRR